MLAYWPPQARAGTVRRWLCLIAVYYGVLIMESLPDGLQAWGLWGLIIYIIFRDIAPGFIKQFTKIKGGESRAKIDLEREERLSRRQLEAREAEAIGIIAQNTSTMAELTAVINSQLASIDTRLTIHEAATEKLLTGVEILLDRRLRLLNGTPPGQKDPPK